MIKKRKHLLLSTLVATLLMNGCGGGDNTTDNDNNNSNNTSTQDIKPQFITQEVYSVKEGETSLFTIQTDINGTTYIINGGADQAMFTLNQDDGTLKFLTPQDFENPSDQNKDGTYEVTIEARNGTATTQQTFYIKLENDPSDDGDKIPPVFNSSTNFTADENEIFSAKIVAIDNESDVTYSIEGGDDDKRFKIDENNGTLTFYHLIPDFEISSDANNDKIYEVTIAATDKDGNKATLDISVSIQDDPTDSTYGTKKVFKTGLNDGGLGSIRNFTNNSDDTVSVLERLWEDTTHINTDISYYDAQLYCARLSLGGEDDWRLPTRRELYELVNYGNSPKIDDVFNYKNAGYFWTSQELFPYSGSPGDENNQAWTIQFGNGIDFASNKDEKNGYHVRCVRGFTIPNGQFSGELSIIDTTTNLEWENNTTAINPTLDWDSAKTRCADLVLEGKDDWRLPNINELHSIIPNNDNEYQFSALTQQKTGPYWSSSALDIDSILYVENYWDEPNQRDVQNDALINPQNNQSVRSRCVRGGE